MASTRINNVRITQEKLMKMIDGYCTVAGSFKEHLATEIIWKLPIVTNNIKQMCFKLAEYDNLNRDPLWQSQPNLLHRLTEGKH